jgi:hypothetical protein
VLVYQSPVLTGSSQAISLYLVGSHIDKQKVTTTLEDIKEETRRLVRHAVVMTYIGEYDFAELLLLRALYNTNDCSERTEAADLLPRIHHRMGQLEAARGNFAHARELFRLAEGSFDRNNVIGRARTLRDLAWQVYRNGQLEEGSELAKSARNLLKQTTEGGELWEKEFIVTDGFVAGTDPRLPASDAVQQFLKVDTRIRGGSDPIYERDNLKRLVRYLPTVERVGYELRVQSIWWRLIANHEVKTVVNDLMEGNFRGATLGSARRITRHLLPF